MFITSAQALDMLEAHAPRAWCKRLVKWEIFNEGLRLYFSKGEIVEQMYAFQIENYALALHPPLENGEHQVNEDIIERVFGVEIATAWKNLDDMGAEISVGTNTWSNEAVLFPIGVLMYGEIDWEEGWCVGAFRREYVEEFLLADTEILQAQHDGASLLYDLGGMRFELEAIEMLAPGGKVPKRFDLSPVQEPILREQAKNIGGRPAANHGAPIAAVTLRLSQISTTALKSYKSELVILDLMEEYKKLGEAAPKGRNLERIAQGILRTVRQR